MWRQRSWSFKLRKWRAEFLDQNLPMQLQLWSMLKKPKRLNFSMQGLESLQKKTYIQHKLSFSSSSSSRYSNKFLDKKACILVIIVGTPLMLEKWEVQQILKKKGLYFSNHCWNPSDVFTLVHLLKNLAKMLQNLNLKLHMHLIKRKILMMALQEVVFNSPITVIPHSASQLFSVFLICCLVLMSWYAID